MANLPKVGVEAVIEGMAAFERDSKKVNQSLADIDTAAGALGKGALGLSGDITNLGSSLLKMGALAGGVVLAGVTALSIGLASFATGGINQAIDLDQQVANIAATMGATRETAGTLKDELKGLALDLSLNPNLTVDVTQAGQAIEVLAANGALATDEFGKLTQASKDLAVQTVALANATGADFTTAATIATDAANVFGLEVDQMGKAVDGAAGIMNASKFNANDYQLALANAGSIAAEMGITLEDFNTVLAGTASNFASGSDAGTSFKALLQRLANPTDEVKAAMEQYGISLFDANGEMRSMSDIAQDLNQVFNGTVTLTSQVGGATKEQAKAAETASKNMGDLARDIEVNKEKLKLMTDVYQESLKFYDAGEPKMRGQALAIEKMTNSITDQEEKLAGYQNALAAVDGAQVRTITSTKELTEAEKAQLAATLGGADGARILLGLADLTGQEFDALSESVNRSGQGLEAAALRVDTVKGAMDIFKGVLQAIQIQVGDAFLPLLKQVAVNFTQFATQSGPAVVSFFGQVATSIGQIVTRGQELFTLFQAQGAGGLLSALGIGPEGIALFVKVSGLIAEVANIITATLLPALSGITSSGLMDTLNVSLGFLNQHFEELKGALLGVTAIAAAGVFTALVAGLMSLLTPINLLIAAAGLLGAAWAGNWFNIQGVAQQTLAVLTTVFNTLSAVVMSLVNTVMANVWPQLQEAFNNITAALNNMGLTWGDVWNALVTATTVVASILGVAILGIIGTITGLVTGFATAFATITSYAVEFQNHVTALFTGLAQAGKGLSDFFTGIFTLNLTQAFSGLQMMVTGVLETIKAAFNLALTSIQATLGGILSFVRGWMASFTGFFDGLAPALGEKFENAWDAIREVWKPEKWFELGESVITGILEGIKENQAEVLEMLKALAADAIQAAKDAIGFGSPAAEFMPIGESMVQGMLLGAKKENFSKKFIDDMNMGGIARQLGGGGSGWKEMRRILHAGVKGSFDALMMGKMSPAQVIQQIEDTARRFNFPPSFASEFAMANGLIEHLNSSVTEFQKAMRLENMGRMVQIGGQFASIGSSFAELLQPQIDERSKIIERLREFLAGGGQGLFKFDFAPHLVGVDHVMMNRVRAQQQLNLLVMEQREQEELITKQKESQQKLSFLQSQLDLIKLGKEVGGNVFQGITFGLNARVEDLLTATNNIVNAMVNQINQDLQIHSPSAVMMEIGQQMMAGLQRGIVSMTPVLSGQLSASVAGPISPMMAGALAGSGDTYNYNTYQLGGNNIYNQTDEAIFEQRVLNVIRRNL